MDFAEKSIEPVLKNQPMDPVLTENNDRCLQRSTFPNEGDLCDSLTRFNFALHQAKEREARGLEIKPKTFMFPEEVDPSQHKERFRLAIQAAKEMEAKYQDTAGPGSTFKTKPADEKDKRLQKTLTNLEVTMTSESNKHHPLETAISEVVDRYSADIQQTKYTKKRCEEILGSYRNIFKAHVEIKSGLEALKSCISSQKDKEDRAQGTDHLLKILQGVKSMIENKNSELDLLNTKINDVQKQHHIKLQEVKDIKLRLKDMKDHIRSMIQANMDLSRAVEETEKYLRTRNTLAVFKRCVCEYSHIKMRTSEDRHTVTQAAQDTAPYNICEDTQPTLDERIEKCIRECPKILTSSHEEEDFYELILQQNGCIQNSRKHGGPLDFIEEIKLEEEHLDEESGTETKKKKSLWRRLMKFLRKNKS
ncbi:hypothetical protein Q8A73_001035 [Channa argus]|nr:hypothetical protein Q8A73_001035 [Channa argus]